MVKLYCINRNISFDEYILVVNESLYTSITRHSKMLEGAFQSVSVFAAIMFLYVSWKFPYLMGVQYKNAGVPPQTSNFESSWQITLVHDLQNNVSLIYGCNWKMSDTVFNCALIIRLNSDWHNVCYSLLTWKWIIHLKITFTTQ